MARPKKRLSSRDREKLMLLAARGLSQASIAWELGITAKTLRRILREDLLAADAYARGLGQEEEALVGSLRRKAEKYQSPVPEIFLLKARHGYEEGTPVAGNGDVRVNILQLPAALSPEQYRALVAGTDAGVSTPAALPAAFEVVD